MPPPYVSPQPFDQTSLETANMVGTILSNLTYGFQLALFMFLIRLHCIRSAPKGTAGGSRQNWSLFAYAILLFLLATAGFCLQTSLNHRAFILHRHHPGGPLAYIVETSRDGLSLSTTAVYVILNWFADGMILYRFYRLFGSTRRALLVSVVMLASLVVVGSKFLPNISQLAENLWTDETTVPSLAYLSLSLSINIVLTVAIIIRLLSYKHMFRQFFGNQDDRMYTFAVCIIVESALPYTAVAILTVVACGINNPMQNALLPMLGQLQGIPPLLIMVGVKWNRILIEGGFAPTPVQTMQFATDTTTFDATATATSEKGILDDAPSLPSPPESCLSPRSVTLGVPPNWAPSSYLFSGSSQEILLQERPSRSVVGSWPNRRLETTSLDSSSSWSSSYTDLCRTLPLSPP